MCLKITILKLLVLTFLVTTLISCKNENNKNDSLNHLINEDINTKANTQFLTDLTTLNLKVISVTNHTEKHSELERTKTIINSIAQAHILINKRLKKIAQKNLIIIPVTLYPQTSSTDTLNTTRDYEYLIKIKQLLQEEIKEYSKVKTHSKNKEIKNLANESIIDLKIKLNEIDLVLN